MPAKLAFHEAMHNKTYQGNAMHPGEEGLAASPLHVGSSIQAITGTVPPQWGQVSIW